MLRRKLTTRKLGLLALVLLMTVSFLPSCATREVRTVDEKHESHIIDYAPSIEQGLRIADDREIKVAIYQDGKVIGFEMKVLNGQRIVPENYLAELEKRAIEALNED